jgi:flagellar biosynthetic protein FlhB
MADGSKTEKATPRKQQKAREEGQVARSREFPSALSMGAVLAAMTWVAPDALAHWMTFYRSCLNGADTSTLDPNGPFLYWASVEVMRFLFPVLLTGMAVSLFAGFAQGGLTFAPKALSLKFSRFNPSSKIGQIFSMQAINNVLRSLLPFTAILWISVSALRDQWSAIVRSSGMEMTAFAALLKGVLFDITWKSCLVMLVWSGVDYLFTWYKLQGDLKMTKQEVREEQKNTEGNPQIKRRVRQIQFELRKKQSLKAAATATVIVTNPTHFAVALRYAPDMDAPMVVAKGRNLLAEQIKQIGRENGITIVENKPLAQALYKAVEVGEAIPGRLYHAVAELLAGVFKAEAELRKRDAKRRSRNASGEILGTKSARQEEEPR